MGAMRKKKGGGRKLLGVHILDKVVEVYEEVAFIPKELAISRAGGMSSRKRNRSWGKKQLI